jgi:membrane-associated protease RseP (regulator of RpoE activity)
LIRDIYDILRRSDPAKTRELYRLLATAELYQKLKSSGVPVKITRGMFLIIGLNDHSHPLAKTLIMIFLLAVLAGCATPSTMLVNRQGKVVRCAATGYGYGIAGAIAIGTAEASHSKCVSDMRRVGFVRLPNVSMGVEWDRVKKSPLTISEVKPASPAERAGLKPGDQVVAVDGKPMSEPFSMIAAFEDKRPGDEVVLKVLRDTAEVELLVALDPR